MRELSGRIVDVFSHIDSTQRMRMQRIKSFSMMLYTIAPAYSRSEKRRSKLQSSNARQDALSWGRPYFWPTYD